jgi:hypothetical protein
VNFLTSNRENADADKTIKLSKEKQPVGFLNFHLFKINNESHRLVFGACWD